MVQSSPHYRDQSSPMAIDSGWTKRFQIAILGEGFKFSLWSVITLKPSAYE
jgi:hypothetical protein